MSTARKTIRSPEVGSAEGPVWTLFVLSILALCVAFSTPRSVQAGDAGEFSTVMLMGGLPHPSGYPLMRILGVPARGLAALGLPPALVPALVCGLFGTAGWFVLFRLAGRWVAAPSRAVILAMIAVSPLARMHVYDAEVWGPLIGMTAGVLWLALASKDVRPFVLGLGLGLATAHHLTAVLLTPLVIGAAWPRGENGVPAGFPLRPLLIRSARGLLGSALGLGLFATLLVGDSAPGAPGWRWGSQSWWAPR